MNAIPRQQCSLSDHGEDLTRALQPMGYADEMQQVSGALAAMRFVDPRETMISVLTDQVGTLQAELAKASQASHALHSEMEKTISAQAAMIDQLQVALAQKEGAIQQKQTVAAANGLALESSLQQVKERAHSHATTIVSISEEIKRLLQPWIPNLATLNSKLEPLSASERAVARAAAEKKAYLFKAIIQKVGLIADAAITLTHK